MIRTEQVGVWAVWTKKGHRPTRFHTSKELAQAEAARLAKLNPQAKFHVVYFDEKVSWRNDDGVIGMIAAICKPNPELLGAAQVTA